MANFRYPPGNLVCPPCYRDNASKDFLNPSSKATGGICQACGKEAVELWFLPRISICGLP